MIIEKKHSLYYKIKPMHV